MRIQPALALCVCASISIGPLPAAADDAQPDGDGGTEIVVGVQYGTPPSGAQGRDANRCAWVPAGAASTTDSGTVDVRVVDGGGTQHLYIRACPRSADMVWIADRTPSELSGIVADEARAKVPAPAFGSAPAAGTAVVNADMWLWTDANAYASVSTRQAWVPTPNGPVWAQATATPIRLVFDSGEPGSTPVVCAGPGDVWNPSLGDDAASSCMYRYRHSSEIVPAGVFTARWSIFWTITTAGSAGSTMSEFVTTTSTPITVREIEAIVVA